MNENNTINYLIIRDLAESINYLCLTLVQLKEIGLKLGIKNISYMNKNLLISKITGTIQEKLSTEEGIENILKFYDEYRELFIFSSEEAVAYMGEEYFEQYEDTFKTNKYYREYVYQLALCNLPGTVIELQALSVKNEYYYYNLLKSYTKLLEKERDFTN